MCELLDNVACERKSKAQYAIITIVRTGITYMSINHG